jgi:hypothetical protein
LEVARPRGYGGLPGVVCVRCRNYPGISADEAETFVGDVLDVDAIVDAVVARISVTAPDPTPPDPADAPEGQP